MPTDINHRATGPALPLDAFEHLIAAFGADEARWPQNRRAAALETLRLTTAEGVAARRCLAEAQALARVLDQVHDMKVELGVAATAALTERIMARADQAQRSPTVVPLRQPSTQSAQRLRADVQRRAQMQGQQAGWATVALLAASLLMGIFVGPGLTDLPGFQDLADAAGLGGLTDQLALSASDGQPLQDEDVL
jgi:hypothetical protein